jgi:hypothetical protein
MTVLAHRDGLLARLTGAFGPAQAPAVRAHMRPLVGPARVPGVAAHLAGDGVDRRELVSHSVPPELVYHNGDSVV